MKQQSSNPAALDGSPQAWSNRVLHRAYQPHIDGMRCLAVVPVLVFHFASGLCPGGFAGVDIFFVISGYLICGGILNDLQKGGFTLGSFYHRRIRRIFPAYFVLVSCSLPAGVFLYHWARIVPLSQTALFSALFSTNIYFWLDMGYFQPNANANPLLHLWTLGVEEQFYIIIPFLTLVLWKISRACVKPAYILGALASLAACILLACKGNSTTAFYILPSRAWEFLAGALIANLPACKKSFRAAWFSLLGLVLILMFFWCFSTRNTYENGGTSVELILPFAGSLGYLPFPGWENLLVVAGGLLLLRYGDAGPVSKVLCSRPFTAVGKISYSLYLWHWPILVYARYATYGRLSPSTLAALFVSSFLAAYLSWRWVELPPRVGKFFTPRFAFACAGLGCALLAGECIFLIRGNGLRDVLHKQANHYTSEPRAFMSNFRKFSRIPAFNPPAYPLVDANYVERLGEPGQKPTFCLIGDSHAEALSPGIDRAAKDYHQAGFYITWPMHPAMNEHTAGNQKQIMDWVAANPDIGDVYLVGRWPREYDIPGGLPDLGDKGKIQPVSVDRETAETIEHDFRYTAQWLMQHGKRVFVFTCVPEYHYSPNDMMARSQIIPLSLPIEISRQDYENRQKPITEILQKLEQEGLLTIVPSGSALVSGDHTIFMSPEGKPYYRDTDHLTQDGAYYVSRAVAPILWPRAVK